MDAGRLYELMMNEYNNTGPIRDYTSSAIGGVNRLTNKRVRDLLSRYATTGMGRTGTSGAALSDVYSTAGRNITEATTQGALMEQQQRQRSIENLLNLYQFEESQPGWEDMVGKLLGSGTEIAAAAIMGG